MSVEIKRIDFAYQTADKSIMIAPRLGREGYDLLLGGVGSLYISRSELSLIAAMSPDRMVAYMNTMSGGIASFDMRRAHVLPETLHEMLKEVHEAVKDDRDKK